MSKPDLISVTARIEKEDYDLLKEFKERGYIFTISECVRGAIRELSDEYFINDNIEHLKKQIYLKKGGHKSFYDVFSKGIENMESFRYPEKYF